MSTAPDTVTMTEQLHRRTHALLSSGIPLSLLLDLADPRGPHSEELFDVERPRASA